MEEAGLGHRSADDDSVQHVLIMHRRAANSVVALLAEAAGGEGRPYHSSRREVPLINAGANRLRRYILGQRKVVLPGELSEGPNRLPTQRKALNSVERRVFERFARPRRPPLARRLRIHIVCGVARVCVALPRVDKPHLIRVFANAGGGAHLSFW